MDDPPQHKELYKTRQASSTLKPYIQKRQTVKLYIRLAISHTIQLNHDIIQGSYILPYGYSNLTTIAKANIDVKNVFSYQKTFFYVKFLAKD